MRVINNKKNAYLCGPMCSFLGCNLSIPFSLGEAVPLSGETGSCEIHSNLL